MLPLPCLFQVLFQSQPLHLQSACGWVKNCLSTPATHFTQYNKQTLDMILVLLKVMLYGMHVGPAE